MLRLTVNHDCLWSFPQVSAAGSFDSPFFAVVATGAPGSAKQTVCGNGMPRLSCQSSAQPLSFPALPSRRCLRSKFVMSRSSLIASGLPPFDRFVWYHIEHAPPHLSPVQPAVEGRLFIVRVVSTSHESLAKGSLPALQHISTKKSRAGRRRNQERASMLATKTLLPVMCQVLPE